METKKTTVLQLGNGSTVSLIEIKGLKRGMGEQCGGKEDSRKNRNGKKEEL